MGINAVCAKLMRDNARTTHAMHTCAHARMHTCMLPCPLALPHHLTSSVIHAGTHALLHSLMHKCPPTGTSAHPPSRTPIRPHVLPHAAHPHSSVIHDRPPSHHPHAHLHTLSHSRPFFSCWFLKLLHNQLSFTIVFEHFSVSLGEK